MIPLYSGQQFDIPYIISANKMGVNINPITMYATKGSLTLKTTFENCLGAVEENMKTELGKVAAPLTEVFSTNKFLSEIKNKLGPYFTYIQYGCLVFVIIIIILTGYKLVRMFL